MVYNADNTKAIERKLKTDHIYTCFICRIDDGVMKDFIPEKSHATWKGDLNQTAINVLFQIKYGEGEKDFLEYSQAFTYNVGEDGKTEYNVDSNMGKYARKYGCVPKVGQEIKILTNGDGKPKLMLE